LHCPNCRGAVHLRGGADKRTQLHFAHQKGECAWSTEAESVRHARGKVVLSHWLHEQYPQATVRLEERLPEPNRIADVFLEHQDGRRWAIEFQCAPLDIAEWRMRHNAYRAAHILDIWIIGHNRYEKQEAFIEAILNDAHEIMFLDPLVTHPRIWLRWPITRQQALEWQNMHTDQPNPGSQPALNGWVGRMGYGMTIIGTLAEIHLNNQGHLLHPTRVQMERQAHLLRAMQEDTYPDEARLSAYLTSRVSSEELRQIIIPLLHSYQIDPELMRRYNYGRGLSGQPVTRNDQQRIDKARQWLQGLTAHGYTPERLNQIFHEIPYIGAYAAFIGYAEVLLTLSITH
jgi:hypothetical protein